MDLNKHIEFFNPATIEESIHIIGCGAIGSNIAMLLARLGCTNIHLWDFDTVEAHNITNQMYRAAQIGELKTKCLSTMMKEVNPMIEITLHEAYTKQNLSGYVFLCVDDIELRKHIATKHQSNDYIKAMFDARMRLTDAQSYGADWSNYESKETFINTMQFSHEEATTATPVSACGTTLSVNPTVTMVAAATVSNFINFVLTKDIKSIILLDAFAYSINAF